MRVPVKYDVCRLRHWDCDAKLPDGHWVPARPVGLDSFSLFTRLKLAWQVFTGKCDVVEWPWESK